MKSQYIKNGNDIIIYFRLFEDFNFTRNLILYNHSHRLCVNEGLCGECETFFTVLNILLERHKHRPFDDKHNRQLRSKPFRTMQRAFLLYLLYSAEQV